MATAKTETRTTTARVTTLELNENEVTTLMRIFHRIGGSPTKSSRKHVEAMKEALLKANVPDATPLERALTGYGQDAIHFVDEVA